MTDSDRIRPGLESRHYFGVFLWGGATLLLELSLTRVLSVALWYHFGFLVISTALLGFGVAGTGLALMPRLRDRASLDRSLTVLAVAFAGLAIVSFRLMQAIPFDPFSALTDPRQLVLGPLYYAVLAAPFVASGLGLALLFSRFAARASRLYAWDLAGAGAGCLALLVVLPWVGGSGAVVVASAAGFAAAALFAGRRLVAAVPVGFALLVALSVPFADAWLPITITPTKRRPPFPPLETHWNTSSRVEVFEFHPPGGGTRRLLFIDGGTAVTGTEDLRPGARDYLRAHPDDTEYLSGVAYPGKRGVDILIIGSGGGSEVLDGLHYGARRITAVEVNPTIVALVRDRMRDYWGGLFQQPEVTLIQDEGRSYLRRSGGRYDAIISRHTISNAAVASGALALTENYVLTREAFEDYFDHLTPDGMIFFSRPEPHIPRLMATAREALAADGVRDAADHFVVFREKPDQAAFGPGREAFDAQLVVKKTPFTAAEISEIGRIARLDLPRRQDGDPERETLYAPGRSGQSLYRDIASTTDLAALYASQPREIAPATDDRPFFNHLTRWSGLDRATIAALARPGSRGNFLLGDRPVAEVSLVILLVQSIIVAGTMILVPLIRLRSAGARVPVRWRSLLYFSALGFGFIVIEMALISRTTLFLGQPTYTIAVVLGGLLIFTGIGSALAARLNVSTVAPLRRAIGLLLIVLALALLAMPAVFSAGLGLPFVLRCAIALAVIAPLGIVLGWDRPAFPGVAGTGAVGLGRQRVLHGNRNGDRPDVGDDLRVRGGAADRGRGLRVGVLRRRSRAGSAYRELTAVSPGRHFDGALRWGVGATSSLPWIRLRRPDPDRSPRLPNPIARIGSRRSSQPLVRAAPGRLDRRPSWPGPSRSTIR